MTSLCDLEIVDTDSKLGSMVKELGDMDSSKWHDLRIKTIWIHDELV